MTRVRINIRELGKVVEIDFPDGVSRRPKPLKRDPACDCQVVMTNAELVKRKPDLFGKLMIAGGSTGGTSGAPSYWEYATCMQCGKQHILNEKT